MNFKSMLIISAVTLSSLAMNGGALGKGVDPANLDLSVSPGENFYLYACGGWMKNNPLDPQYARFGTFDQLGQDNLAQLRELIEGLGTSNAKGSLAQKVSDLYLMGMDSTRLNKEGFDSLKAYIEKFKGKKSNYDIIDVISFMHLGISAPLFDTGVMADLKSSDENLFYVTPGSLSMGDRDYYLEGDDNSLNIRKEFANYIERVMMLAGYKKNDAKRVAKNVIAIETELAKSMLTREDSRDYSRQYNIFTIDDLKSSYQNINWDKYFNGIGIHPEKACVMQPKATEKANELLATLKPQELNDYLAFKFVDAASSYLSDDFVQANFDFYSRAMSGKTVMQPRWKRALGVPNGILGEAVGELYVKKYFPEESKQKMLALVDNLRRALGEHIAGLTWMSPATKVNALVKLNSFTVKIGYPDKWRDYTAVDINPERSYVQNVFMARAFEANYQYNQLGKPVDKERWQMTPQTVNAYYDPSTNEICFPAGILQKPFFDPEADDACNYGAIGVVIGHEMTHGFDDQGRNFDQNGNMVDWWTEDDAKAFQALADKLGAQYSAEIVADDVHANGTFTMGENIADHGGLRIAYSAFKKTKQGQSDELIDGFTPDQRFYLAYANVWAANITKQEILRRTKIDPHSLGVNRVNVAIRNLEPFFQAFGIKEGDKMFRREEDRVTIW